MKFCVPLIIGIIAGWLWNVPFQLTGLFFVLFVVLYVVVGFTRFFGSNVASYLPYVIIFCFGIIKITIDHRLLPDDNIAKYVKPNTHIQLKGKVTDLPVVRQQLVRWVVEAESVVIYNKSYPASGGVYTTVKKDLIDKALLDSLTYGRAVTLHGELVAAGSARNPGEFDFRRYLHLNNIYARLYVDRFDQTALGLKEENTFLGTFVHPVRRSIAQRIDALIKGDEAKFLKGLIIGERSEIPLEVKTAFINSGVMHILAVSGLHVLIVVAMLLIIFQLLRIPEFSRTLLTIVLLIYYIFLTGAAASVVRSVIMAIIFLGAKLFEQKHDVYNTLACSAIVILLIDARQLFQPGFQLSFAAVFSLVYLFPKINAINNFLPQRVRENRAISLIIASLAVSIAAGIGTIPFTSYYFGKISLVSIVANVVIVPLSNVILALGMLSVALSYFWFWCASMYAEVTSILTWCILQSVEWFGSLPFAYIDTRFTFQSSMMFYLTLGVLVNLWNKRYDTLSIIVALITANLILYYYLIAGPSTPTLKVTFLDVGQGDAIYVEFPDGKNALIDAGPKTMNIDAGARFIAPYLKFRGVNNIHAIIVSHPHSDHLGGMPTLLRSFNVDTVYDAGSFSSSALQEEYLHLINSLNVHRRILSSGMTINIDDNIRLYMLHPLGQLVSASNYRTSNLNNESLVIKIIYGQTSVLLMGDAEHEAEKQIEMTFGAFLNANILKAGHHGSITSSTFSFLENVQPNDIVISVGAKNKFHHPSPVVLERYRKLDGRYYRTDEEGAIIFESDGSRWRRIDWR